MPATNFNVSTQFGDASGPTYTGTRTFTSGTGGNNPIGINQPVAANSSVVPLSCPNTSTWDIPIYDSTITNTQIYAFGFAMPTSGITLNGNANTPVNYIKLLNAGAAGVPLVIPIRAGESIAWQPTPTKDANGNTMNTTGQTILGLQAIANSITKITCTPDPVSNTTIVGTIEVTS